MEKFVKCHRLILSSLVLIVAAAVGVRALLLLAFLFRAEWDVVSFLSVSDAGSFKNVASCLAGLASPGTLSMYDGRVFPGWPLLLAPGFLAFPALYWMHFLTLGLVGLCLWLFSRFTDSTPALLLFALTPPAWVLNGVHAMAEPAFLAGSLGALFLASRRQWLWAGVLGGFTCVIKPYGIFPALGLVVMALWSDPSRPGRVRDFTALAVGGLGGPLVYVLLNLYLFGNPIRQFAVYGMPLEELNVTPEIAEKIGHASGHWGMPFVALLQTPWLMPTSPAKILYIYAHAVAVILLGVGALYRFWKGKIAPTPVNAALLAWLWGCGFAIFCGGPYWGFHGFDRYCVWLWPALLLLYAEELKKREWLSWGLCGASLALSVLMVFRH